MEFFGVPVAFIGSVEKWDEFYQYIEPYLPLKNMII